MPRLRGENGHLIQYRHIIDWLVKKPGAFENYRYRDALFPTHRFRMAYDHLQRSRVPRNAQPRRPTWRSSSWQHTQAKAAVDRALERLLDTLELLSVESREPRRSRAKKLVTTALRREAIIIPVDLSVYDRLLTVHAGEEVAGV